METCPRQVQHLALSTEKYRRYINILYYLFIIIIISSSSITIIIIIIIIIIIHLGEIGHRQKVLPLGNSHLSMRKIASVCVLQIKCWCNSKSIAEPNFVIFSCFWLKFFGSCPHESAHFWNGLNTIRFYPDWCGQGLSLFPTGEWFQNNVVLVTGFTGSCGRNWELFV